MTGGKNIWFVTVVNSRVCSTYYFFCGIAFVDVINDVGRENSLCANKFGKRWMPISKTTHQSNYRYDNILTLNFPTASSCEKLFKLTLLTDTISSPGNRIVHTTKRITQVCGSKALQ